MKRFYAFLLTCFTILVLMVATIPNIKNSLSTSPEYQSGYEVVYKIEDLCSEKEFACKTPEEALKTIQGRFDYLKTNDRTVVLEGNDQIKVNIPADNYSDAISKLEDIELNKVVTVGDGADSEVFMFENIVDVKTIEYFYNSSTSTYSVSFKITDKGADRLSRLDSDTLAIVLWDKYYESTKNDEGNYRTYDDLTIKDGKMNINFSDTTTIVEDSLAFCYGNLGVKLTQDSIVKVDSKYEAHALAKYIIAVAVVAIVICGLLIRFYHRAGVLGSIATIFSMAFSFIFFYWMSGIYSYLSCLASVLSAILTAGLFIYITQKIRVSLYKGRSLHRAFNEGYQKSIGGLVDVAVLTLGAAIIGYFSYKGGLRDVALMSFSASVSALLFVGLGYFAAGSFLFAGKVFAEKNMFNINENDVAGLDTDSANFVEDRLTVNNSKKANKKFIFVLGGLLLAAGIVFGVFQGVTGNGFNYSNNLTTNSVIRVAADNDALATKKDALDAINASGLDYEDAVYGISTVEDDEGVIQTKYVITLYGKGDSLVSKKANVVEALSAKLGTDYEDGMVYAATYKSAEQTNAIWNFVKAYLFIMILLVAYFFVRYGIKLTLASTAATLLSVIAFVGSEIILRVPFDTASIAVGYIVLVASSFFNVLVADKIRSYIHENEDTVADETANKVIGFAGYSLVLVGFVAAAFCLVSMAMANKYTVAAYGSLLVSLVAAISCSLFVIVTIWKKLRANKLLGRRITIKKIKVEPVEGEPREYTFTGIND